MIKTLYIASSNEGKVVEFEKYLSKLDIDLQNLSNKNFAPPVEASGSFSGNALIKAKYYFDLLKEPVLADDSGICIDALDGFPGVDTSEHKPKNNNFDSLYQLILKSNKLTDKAHFKCCLCFIEKQTEIPLFFEGVCHGSIAETPRGKIGLGFDPIFIPNGSNKTFAEMEVEEKRSYSARGQAIDAFIDFIQNQ